MTARKKNEEGSLRAQLLVDPKGVPKACRILASSNFADLDAATCELMRQMRFEPARDASGAPVQSSYARDVIWLLTDPRPFASSTLKVRASISGGRQTSCDVLGGEGPYVAAWSALACPLLRDLPYYFGAHWEHSASASIEFRLDAGDGALLLKRPWEVRPLIAAEKLSFVVNGEGDPTMCTPLETHGFGPRSPNATSPCPDLLTLLWFYPPEAGAPPRKGTFETRVYLTGEDADQ
jgi:TonB family protein